VRSSRLILLVVVFSFGCSSARQSVRQWGDLAVHDARALLTAPARVTAAQWKRAAVVTGAVIASTALDEQVRDAARANQSQATDNIAEIVEPFGGRYADRVVAGFLLAGVVTRNQKTRAVAFDAFVSSMLASKVVTPILKNTIHRSRPNDGEQAFPSNHATNAFAVASAISAHYDSKWVAISAYSLATLVGLARIHHDDHWLSDVAAGAAIGTVMGKLVAATNEKRRASWTIAPVVDARRRGVIVHVSW
jgi:membrane-associated phospholipid phosphatase